MNNRVLSCRKFNLLNVEKAVISFFLYKKRRLRLYESLDLTPTLKALTYIVRSKTFFKYDMIFLC